jgi:taurine dioxygenase
VDNADMTSTVADVQVKPIGGALGARVDGIDLSRPLTAETRQRLFELLDQHLVLFLPAQGLDDEQHLTFATALGDPYVHPLSRAAGQDDVAVGHIVDSVEHPPYQDRWHTDVSWDVRPPDYGTLRAIEMPSKGGDTVWADTRAAYDALSPVMQRIVEPLEAWHDMGAGRSFNDKAGEALVARTRELFPGAAHPVVGTHPHTGRRFLNVNKEFTSRIVGMAPDESAAMLRFLVDHVTNPNYQMRYQWSVGDVAIWDERCTQHFAVADYLPERREMARVAVLDRRTAPDAC